MDPTARSPAPRRDFALLDLLILVAAAAGAMALSRSFVREVLDQQARFAPFLMPPATPIPTWRVFVRGPNFFGLGSRVAGMLMLGLLLIEGRPPWRSGRRLSRRPGFVACTAAASAMGVNAIVVGAVALFETVPLSGVWNPFEPIWQSRVGPAILAAWLFLGLSGRWRSDRGWVDRSGRLLGLFWLAEVARPWFDRYLSPLTPASWWDW